MAWNFGMLGKDIGESGIGKRVLKTAEKAGVKGTDDLFRMIGTPSMRGIRSEGRQLTREQFIRSGKRRTAGIGLFLGANAMIGPGHGRMLNRGSAGRTGQLYPRSTGGYAG